MTLTSRNIVAICAGARMLIEHPRDDGDIEAGQDLLNKFEDLNLLNKYEVVVTS